MRIAIPLYEGFTALDAIGPFEVLSRVRGAEVTFVGEHRGPVRTENERAAVYVDVELEELAEPEIVCVPGGFGSRALLDDERLLGWIRHAHQHSEWTTSVCTGSLLLAAAGVLDGVPATTHWLAMDLLEKLGARPVGERIVEQGKVITAAGVSAGIDMALTLVARIAGEEAAQAVQLSIEYDPQPPFDAGSPRTAPAELVERMRAGARAAGGAR